MCVRSIISSLKLGDYLAVQAHKPCFISHRVLAIFFLLISTVKKTSDSDIASNKRIAHVTAVDKQVGQ